MSFFSSVFILTDILDDDEYIAIIIVKLYIDNLNIYLYIYISK